MDDAVDRLERTLARTGCEDWLLPPATPEEVAEVVAAAAPRHVPSELIDLWRRHAGVAAGTSAPWFIGWTDPAAVLRQRAHEVGIDEGFPGRWPYWNDERWLPIAAVDRDTFFLVLGDAPTTRSLVGVRSSSALDLRVQQSSLRSWVLSHALAMGTLADLDLDPRAVEVQPYGWWDTAEHHLPPDHRFPPGFIAPLIAGLPEIAPIDAATTWPEAGPFRVGTGDPLGGAWVGALGVDVS